MAAFGIYGKLPGEGDFVTRRLPWEFTSAWDDWLAQGLQSSREALGAHWLDAWLSAPVWRFQLAPGVCGPQGWRGLFFASVDRVGRYFPLTLAAPDEGPPAIASLAADDAAWLAAEDAALSGLDPRQPIDRLDALVQALPLPARGAPAVSADGAPAPRVCLFTHGTPAVAAAALSLAGLPPTASFARFIAAPAPGPAPAPAPGPDVAPAGAS